MCKIQIGKKQKKTTVPTVHEKDGRGIAQVQLEKHYHRRQLTSEAFVPFKLTGRGGKTITGGGGEDWKGNGSPPDTHSLHIKDQPCNSTEEI